MKRRGRAAKPKARKPSGKGGSSRRSRKALHRRPRLVRKPPRRVSKHKRSKGVSSKSRSSRVKPSSTMFEPLEQVSVTCSNCGRQFNIVKLHGLSTEGMICQRCNVGEIEFPEN